MLRILRQLTPEESRAAALQCGARNGGSPEEIIAHLARLCGIFQWGIFPVRTDDVLLDYVGRALGMPPLVRGPGAVTARERAIFAAFFRQAWQAAEPERRRRLLERAVQHWDTPRVPAPKGLADTDDEGLGAVLESLMQHSAGCRALAAATQTVPLPLPTIELPPGPIPLSPRGRGTRGSQAMYTVLLILWRARARLLRERRVQRAHHERQLRQVDSLLAVRRQVLSSVPVPWEMNPRCGLSVAAGAGLSLGVHAALAALSPLTVVPALIAGAAGLAWAASAAGMGPRYSADPRVSQLHTQIRSLRAQLSTVDRAILELESE